MRSTHSCRCAETCSDSSARRWSVMNSSAVDAHGGSCTSSTWGPDGRTGGRAGGRRAEGRG
eukprot:5302427-Prymnesium_polylepis.1